MTSPQPEPTTLERIRSAEGTVDRAQTALYKARAGLEAAEEVAMTAEEMKRHPVRIALIGLVMAVIVAALAFMIRGRLGD